MGLITKWRNFSKRQWDNWGSKLQKKYDYWKDFDDPDLREKCRNFSMIISEKLQKKLFLFIQGVAENYGTALAEKVVKKIVATFD